MSQAEEILERAAVRAAEADREVVRLQREVVRLERLVARAVRPSGVRAVVIESPFAGDVEANRAYLIRALEDSVARGESPYASHAFLPIVLDDGRPRERAFGILLGEEWRRRCDLTVFYLDRGWSAGMVAARASCRRMGIPIEERRIL